MLSASGNLFKCHEEVLYLQPLIPPKRLDIFPPITGGCSEGLGVLWFFFKHDKRRMRAQEQCSVRSVVLDADDFG